MSDLDKDMRGGRLRCLGEPREPTDAVRLCDLEVLKRGTGTSPFPSGGRGARGPQGPPGSPAAIYQMTLGPELDSIPIPFINAGTELVSVSGTLKVFRARRGVAGSAGMTTIQLEHNGAVVAGAVLSWTPADAAFALKSVTVNLPVMPADRLSFSLLESETGAEDIFAETN